MTTELYENEWLFAEKILLEKEKLEQENKQLKELNKQLKEEIKKYINSNNFVYDELYKKRETIEKILGDKE